MTLAELENLVRLRWLKREPPGAEEIRGLLRSGEARLADAANRSREPLAFLAERIAVNGAQKEGGGGR